MEEIICVDLNDNIIGYGEKLACHEKPILHRAFSVFLYHDGKMLIQQRNKGKYHSGGLYANSCCSHPRKGEELSQAVPRRLQQELGVCAEVKEAFSFVYFSTYNEHLFEYEYDHVFIGEYDGPVHYDLEEIDHVEWVGFEQLRERMLKSPQEFATWFMIAAPKVLDILQNNRQR